jgi:hypothetical protein
MQLLSLFGHENACENESYEKMKIETVELDQSQALTC